jgi:hypothetical protein
VRRRPGPGEHHAHDSDEPDRSADESYEPNELDESDDFYDSQEHGGSSDSDDVNDPDDAHDLDDAHEPGGSELAPRHASGRSPRERVTATSCC